MRNNTSPHVIALCVEFNFALIKILGKTQAIENVTAEFKAAKHKKLNQISSSTVTYNNFLFAFKI